MIEEKEEEESKCKTCSKKNCSDRDAEQEADG